MFLGHFLNVQENQLLCECAFVSICMRVCVSLFYCVYLLSWKFYVSMSVSLCLRLVIYVFVYLSVWRTHTHFIRCALTSFTGKRIWYACFRFQRYSWSGLQLESEFHWAIIICSCVTFLTLLLKWHFSPQAWNALNAAKFWNQRFTRGTRPRVGLYLLSKNFNRTWRQ